MRMNLLQLQGVGQIPLHDGHVSTSTEQTTSTQTQRLDTIRMSWLKAAASVDDASTVRRDLEHLYVKSNKMPLNRKIITMHSVLKIKKIL